MLGWYNSHRMKQSKKESSLKFPKDFLWGAATSAHQVEGGNHNQWSVWELENARAKAERAKYELSWLPDWDTEVQQLATDPDNYVSVRAVDHYNKYEEDFDILQKLNMNVFRFSVEWSRIEPSEGSWNPEAIDHYRKYIKALRARNIEPMMTLMHWSLPTWYSEMGGFEKRRNIKYFVRFAEKVLSEFGSDVKFICTINEPEVYAYQSYYEGNWPPNKRSRLKMICVYFNLASAHNQVAKMARQLNSRFKIGLSKNCMHHYPGDDAFITRVSAVAAVWLADYLFLDRVHRNLDWLGLNYYFSNRYYGYRVHNPDKDVSDLGWDMQPANLQFVLERLYERYKIPIIVTESGVADRGDKWRRWWITQSVMAMYRAMENGVKLDGYLHWSLLDNFEWAYGKWPHFGLVEVNYDTLKRTPRKSAVWFGQLIKKIRGL